MTPDVSAANADQVAYWNGENGDKWARLQERLDGLFRPISEAIIAAAAPRPGDHVLDVGCGCGDTTLALGRAVGSLGSVTGVDISAPMLSVAGRRIMAENLTQAAVLEADAAAEPFAPGAFDLVFSRFGVMFFDAPVVAFINIHRALKPGGRLVFACWRPFNGNPWFFVPYKAAVPHLPDQEKTDPEAPGPFAFAAPERVSRILGLAGFSDIRVESFDALLTLAPAGAVEEAMRFVTQVGPVSRAMGTGSEAQRQTAERAVVEALRSADSPDGIRLGGQCWFVSAVA
ncbi:MAG: class I SAM-dependent methyltransferase [Janthinobacterium lividum]